MRKVGVFSSNAFKAPLALLVAVTLACPATALAAEDEASSASTAVAEKSQGQDDESYVILKGESDIEKIEAEYKDAQAAFDEANAKVLAIQADIDKVEAEIPIQQARSDIGMKQRYIVQSNPLSFVDVFLSSETLNDALRYSDYLEHIMKSGLEELARLTELKAQLDEARAEQERINAEVNARYEAADAALKAEHEARAKKQAEGIAEAVKEAEEGIAVDGASDEETEEESDDKSDEASKDSKSSSKSNSSKSSSSKESSSKKKTESDDDSEADSDDTQDLVTDAVPNTETENLADGVDWSVSEEEFLEEWTERIDAYLEGSPLEGQGVSFASAAWKYCIDPRWSPAISLIESSKGSICIRPYNAWGWGAADSDPYGLALEWSSWEEAIDAHVAGLAKGYGYTVSMSRAYTYCPVNWKYWYNVVLREMGTI